MFEGVRQSLRDAMNRASSPAEGRAVLAMMRNALVDAKVGVSQVRAALESTRAQLVRERAELETAQRRRGLAAGIRDEETVRVAERFVVKHGERVVVLERKLEAQQAELALAERELQEMSDQFRSMAAGGAPVSPAGSDPLPDDTLAADLDSLRRRAEHSAREAEADRKPRRL